MQAISTESKNLFHRINAQYGYVETVDAVSGEVIAVQNDVNENVLLGKMDDLLELEIDGKTILMQKGMSLSKDYVPKNSKYSRPFGDLIIQAIIEGMGITKACEKYNIAYSTVMHWADKYPDFGKDLDKAKRYRADQTHDKIVELVDKLIGENSKTLTKTQVEAIGKAADILKWSAEKSDPNRFGGKGEKAQQGAVQIIIQTGIDRSTPESITAEVT